MRAGQQINTKLLGRIGLQINTVSTKKVPGGIQLSVPNYQLPVGHKAVTTCHVVSLLATLRCHPSHYIPLLLVPYLATLAVTWHQPVAAGFGFSVPGVSRLGQQINIAHGLETVARLTVRDFKVSKIFCSSQTADNMK